MDDIPIIEEGEGGYYTILGVQKTFHKYRYHNTMEIIIQSKYVKAGENIQKDDIVKIKNEGKYAPGKYGLQLEFQLELIDGNVKTYTPNVQTQMNLIQAFGKDSKNWIDKDLKAWVYDEVKKGKITKRVILTPTDWTEPVKQIDLGETNTEDIDVKNIPF